MPKRKRLKIEYVEISTLLLDLANPRDISRENLLRLSDGVKEFGAEIEGGLVEGIIARAEDGLVISGHQRLKVMKAHGEKLAPVIYLEGLSDKRARELNLLINNPDAQGRWDLSKLSAYIGKGTDLKLAGFDPDNIADLLGSLNDLEGLDLKQDENTGADVKIEPPKDPESVEGEIYELGRHRLMCGDATDPEQVAALMGEERAAMIFTDPPYAIYGSSTGVASDITDDSMVRPFFRDIWRACQASLQPFGHVYICCDWRSWSSWWETAKITGMSPKNMIVWDKGGGLGAMFANCHELLFFGSFRPLRGYMVQKISGERTVSGPNVWRIQREKGGEDRLHNAQKPVELPRKAIEYSTQAGDLVVDFFVGTGTTIIAAELTGRTCYAMELKPSWCDVTRQRFKELKERTA